MSPAGIEAENRAGIRMGQKRVRAPWPAPASFQNPLVLVIVSMVAGALFGWASGKLAGALTKEA